MMADTRPKGGSH